MFIPRLALRRSAASRSLSDHGGYTGGVGPPPVPPNADPALFVPSPVSPACDATVKTSRDHTRTLCRDPRPSVRRGSKRFNVSSRPKRTSLFCGQGSCRSPSPAEARSRWLPAFTSAFIVPARVHVGQPRPGWSPLSGRYSTRRKKTTAAQCAMLTGL